MAVGILKLSNDPTAPVRAQAAASPLPQVTVPTLAAPAGKKGPIGTSPRTNYSRVNTGAPPAPDAGAAEQKSLSPKYGSTMNGTSSAYRPTLQDMIKSAAMGALSRDRISKEAARQAASLDEGTKTAEEKCPKCSKSMSDCTCKGKMASAVKVPTAYAQKTADALTFLAHEVSKEAAPNMPPPHLEEKAVGPGTGPGAIELNKPTGGSAFPFQPGSQGHGKDHPPMTVGTEKVHKPEHGSTAMDTNMAHPTPGKAPLKIVGGHKTAAAKEDETKTAAAIYQTNLERLGIKPAAEETKTASLLETNMKRLGLTKSAEDAINPAHISAGPAVPPQTNVEKQKVPGEPVGGAPQGATGLIASNQSSIDYKKSQAKAAPKADLKTYLDQPALSGEADKTLSMAFDNTGRAGTKFASADENHDEKVKTGAARALLQSFLTNTAEKA